MRQSELSNSSNSFAFTQIGVIHSVLSAMSEQQTFVSVPDTSRFFGAWPKVDSWSEVTPLMALSDLDLKSSPTDRMRSESQCSSGTSGLFTDPFGSVLQSPRSVGSVAPMGSDLGSPETRARQRWAENDELPARMFNPGAGNKFPWLQFFLLSFYHVLARILLFITRPHNSKEMYKTF